MLFYPSKTHDRLNGRPFAPDAVTGTAMVNPHYPRVTVPPGVRVICDSGAFQERDMLQRLTPMQAIERQCVLRAAIAKACGYPFDFEAVVTYDCLVGVDEAIIDGKRVKRRGNEETARYAVRETIRSAEVYACNRPLIGCPIAFSCQGATPRQYAACAEEIVPLMKPADIFAFGGFCILGMQKRLLPVFVQTLERVLPMLSDARVRRAHILGVCWTPPLCIASEMGKRHGVAFSTDSSSIEVNSIMGKVWTDGRWEKVYGKDAKLVSTSDAGAKGYHPADLAIENTRRFHAWSSALAGQRSIAPVIPPA